LENEVTAYGQFAASDRVAGAELLQKDIAKRRREEREAMEAYHAANSEDEGSSSDDDEGDSEDDDEEAGEEEAVEGQEEEEEEEDDLPDVAALARLTVAKLKEILVARELPTVGKKADLIQRLDESRGAAEIAKEEEEEEVADDLPETAALTRLTVAKLKEILLTRELITTGKKADLIQRLEESRRVIAVADSEQEEEQEEDGDSSEDGEQGESDDEEGASESDGDEDDGRYRDPVTGRKRQRIDPALTTQQKKAMAAAAVDEAQAAGAPKPKVRKNGILSLSELRRRHKVLAKAKREQAELDGEGADGDDSDSEEAHIEHERILTSDDFKRIKALKTQKQLSGVMDKGGARKANDTAAEELRAMLRRADKSAIADRRVDPDALAAIGVKRAHDKESRVASIMAGREDRDGFGSAQVGPTRPMHYTLYSTLPNYILILHTKPALNTPYLAHLTAYLKARPLTLNPTPS
jgi:hypothetical protein